MLYQVLKLEVFDDPTPPTEWYDVKVCSSMRQVERTIISEVRNFLGLEDDELSPDADLIELRNFCDEWEEYSWNLEDGKADFTFDTGNCKLLAISYSEVVLDGDFKRMMER